MRRRQPEQEIPAAARLCAAAGSRRRLGMGELAQRRVRSCRRRYRRGICSPYWITLT